MEVTVKYIISFLTAAYLLIPPTQAATLRVPSQYPTIQAGINASVNGDTVLIADGIYTGPGNFDITYGGRNILVMSENGHENCIVDCDSMGRGFMFNSRETGGAVLRGLTILNGYVMRGGGVYCDDSSPTIDYCIFKNNTSYHNHGAGIFLTLSNSTISRCVFTDNSAGACSGIGGGIHCAYSYPTIINCTISGNYAAGGGGGIGTYHSDMTVINTIVAFNSGPGGIYFWEENDPVFRYCDLWDSFVGNPPQWIGRTTGINANGHHCDVYYNIYMDPRFISSSDFHLQTDSPCIDAGAPNSPRDPDGTTADIGRYYFDQGIVAVTLEPHNPPITIPSAGGSFTYTASIRNSNTFTISPDIWTEAIRTPGRQYGPFLLRYNVNLPANTIITRELAQFIPGIAPWGGYWYIANLGIYPDSIVAADTISVMKLPGDSPPNHNLGWNISGWFDDTDAPLILNSQFLILNSSPNPFNAETDINFKLQTSSYVLLAIYDISGREIAVLAEGFYGAGNHQVEWDASSMASGMYFARLEAGNAVQTQKLLLVK